MPDTLPVLALLTGAAHALRSFEKGNAAPELAREMAAAIELKLSYFPELLRTAGSFGDGFVLGMLQGVTPGMIQAGAEALEGAPEMTGAELVAHIARALVAQGMLEHFARYETEAGHG